MPPKKSHVGERYGYLEVIGEAPPQKDGVSGHPSTCWLVLCHSCGQKKVMRWQNIKKARSCGCINVNSAKEERACERCGAHFIGTKFTRYCPDCQEWFKEQQGKKGNSVMRFHTKCELCGKPFEAGSKNAKFCPDCKLAARRQRKRLYYQRVKSGTNRKLGGETICADCGKPFILKSGFQKYCPECEKIHRILTWKDFKGKYGK